jgi:hypothetical protein
MADLNLSRLNDEEQKLRHRMVLHIKNHCYRQTPCRRVVKRQFDTAKCLSLVEAVRCYSTVA